MAETAVLTNISDMIDLAIGSPEVGVVDFCMLQTVLHCLAQQLCVLNKNVELRGGAGLPPVGHGRDAVQSVLVNEYIIDTDGKETAPEKKKKIDKKSDEPNTLLIVERVKKEPIHVEGGAPAATPVAPASTTPVPPVAPARAPPASTTRVPPASTTGLTAPAAVSSVEKLSLVTLSKFNLLENAVEDLKNRVYGSMPKNEEILQEVRSQTNLKAITDMWTSLNVSSRLEAAEAGLGKLSSLVQDLIGESTGLQQALNNVDAKSAMPVIPAAVPSQRISPEQQSAMVAHVQRLHGDLDELKSAFYTAMQDLQPGFVPPPPLPPLEPALSEIAAPPSPSPLKSMVSQIAEPPPPSPLKSTVSQIAAPPSTSPRKSAVSQIAPPLESAVHQTEAPRRVSTTTAGLMERLAHLEQKVQKCCDSIGKNDGLLQDQMANFQDQLENLQKQVAVVTGDLGAGKLSPDLIKDLQGLMELFKTVQEMQEQLKQVHETALQLAAEKDDRQYHMNALLEQIELLKTIKLDREDMVEAMADKADMHMLARKVSHDQFEMACDDLSRGLEHAIGKLNEQEALWQHALDDIQREIETKLDKMELSPVKAFFNTKLRQLQESLKQMASLRREAEAAGTKRRLLRDVNCISCDAQAVMPMESNVVVPTKALPGNLSMKPYLSYELDAIRKAQASNVQHRNMHDWETIDKQMSQPRQPHKVRSETDKHICNRYCGGSHTVTTAAQRVARLGHFIKQWGPDVVPLSSGYATGDDGKMYKISPSEDAKVGPGGAVDAIGNKKPRVSESKTLLKPVVTNAECRCLE